VPIENRKTKENAQHTIQPPQRNKKMIGTMKIEGVDPMN